MPKTTEIDHIARRLKEAREDAGLTKMALAAKVGSSDVAIKYWEEGDRKVSIETLRRLAKALDRPLDYFLDYEG